MATTKKTVKSDATDKKKTTASKKTTVKKEVESTGVVDEFLNENIGKVVTETPKPEKKPITKKKPTPKPQKPEAVKETNEKKVDDVESTISDQEDVQKKWEELGLNNESQADIQKVVSDLVEQSQDTPEEDDKPKDVVYPPIIEKKEKAPTVDDLRVNLQTNPQQKFTYVNISMGVKYD